MNRRASLLALRWVASLTLALLLFYRQPLPYFEATPDWIGWVLCLALALSNLALHRTSHHVPRRRQWSLILFLLDLVMVSAVVYMTSFSDSSGLSFFAVLMICALSGAITGDARVSFIIALGTGGIYLFQLHASQSPLTALEPGTLLRLPLLLTLSLSSALLSRDSERAASHRAEILAALSRQLRITMPTKEIAAQLGDILVRRLGYRKAALYLADPDQVTLRRMGDESLPATIDSATLPSPITGRLRAGFPLHAQQLAAARAFATGLGTRPRATIIVPMTFTDRAPGMLIVEHTHRIFDPEPQAAFLTYLADYTASAITNARMVESAQESAIGLHSLLKMSEVVSSTLRIRDILNLLEEFCARLVGVGSCSLWVGRRTLAGTSGASEPGRRAREQNASSPVPLSGQATTLEQVVAFKVWEEGTELLLNSREAVQSHVAGAAASNLMALPLRTANEVLGVLVAIDKPGTFTQRDRSLLEGLASQATIALVNARLVEGLEERAVRITHLIETLAAEKHKLEHVLSNMEEAVVLLDATGQVVLANHAGRRLLGPGSTTRLPAEASSFRDPLGILRRVTEVLATRDPVHETVPDGERYYELSTAIVKGDEGAIAVVRDITELVRVDAMRTDFVSHVSHELRTPLASIIGSMKLVLENKDGQLTDTQNRLLRIAERESGRLMELINDLLDLAKLEAGRAAIEKEDVDLGAVIAEAIESIQPLAAAKSIRLDNECDSTGVTVPCDSSLIRQVLQNLIGNAIKFTPEGGSVRISARMEPRWAVVRVDDTGIGIPRDKWEAVFNKFEQLPHRGLAKGTGLGLAICRQIVQRHGGQIAVASEEGRGSTFYFTLPRGEPIIEARAPDPEPGAQATESEQVRSEVEQCPSPMS